MISNQKEISNSIDQADAGADASIRATAKKNICLSE